MKTIGMCAVLLGVALTANVQASNFEGAYAGLNVGNNTAAATAKSDKNSSYAGVKGGYNWDWNRFLIGAEGFYDGHGSSYTNEDTGLDARLGLPMNNWLPYVKLGMVVSTPSNRPHGGVGVEYSLTDRWAINAEWTVNSKDVGAGVTMTNNNIAVGFSYLFGGAARTADRAAADRADADRAAAEKAAAEKAAADKAAAERLAAMSKAERAAAEKAAADKAAADRAAADKAATEKAAANPAYKTVYDEKKITLEGTSFASGSAVLNKAASAELDKAVEFANANKEADLLISGYTDDRGDAAKNVKLSAARAEAVKAFLIKHGVAAERLATKGEGSANPVADNKTVEGRAKNRRVEISAVVKEAKKVLVQ